MNLFGARLRRRTVYEAVPGVPDGLPSLARGAHPAGSGEACIMELVSVLAGERWSDHPRCTHPTLASIAVHANDCLPDSARHLLVPHITRLIGTNTDAVGVALSRYCKVYPYPAMVHKRGSKYGYEYEADLTVAWLAGALDVAERHLDRRDPMVLTPQVIERARREVLAH